MEKYTNSTAKDNMSDNRNRVQRRRSISLILLNDYVVHVCVCVYVIFTSNLANNFIGIPRLSPLKILKFGSIIIYTHIFKIYTINLYILYK